MIAIISIIESMKRGRPELVACGDGAVAWVCGAWGWWVISGYRGC